MGRPADRQSGGGWIGFDGYDDFSWAGSGFAGDVHAHEDDGFGAILTIVDGLGLPSCNAILSFFHEEGGSAAVEVEVESVGDRDLVGGMGTVVGVFERFR